MAKKNDFTFINSSINEQQQEEFESAELEEEDNKKKKIPTQDLALIIFGLFCCDGIF